MKLPKSAVLKLVIQGYAQSRSPIRVPADLVSKAKSLCRDGLLIECEGAAHFRPSPMGNLLAGDLDG